MTQPTNHIGDNYWSAELLRLSVFFSSATEADSKWWETIVGEAPETTNIQAKIGVRQDEGPYNDGRLILTALNTRADLVFISAFDTETRQPSLDQLSSYNSALPSFMQVATRWLEICPLPIRVAFGTTLDIPESNRQAGYVRLKAYLPALQIDGENSSDLLYQINRRRESRQIPGVMINRLSKWSVALSKFSQMELGPASVQYIISGNERYFARLELDINTVPEHREAFSREQLPALLAELVTLATEIAIKGDIK